MSAISPRKNLTLLLSPKPANDTCCSLLLGFVGDVVQACAREPDISKTRCLNRSQHIMFNTSHSCKLVMRGSQDSKLTLQDSVKAELVCSSETLDPMSQQCFFGADLSSTAFQRIESLCGFLGLQIEERVRLFERIADKYMAGNIADTVVPIETANPMLNSWWILLDLNTDRKGESDEPDSDSDPAWSSTNDTYCDPVASQVGSGQWKLYLACSASSTTGFLRTQPILSDTPLPLSDTSLLDLQPLIHFEPIDWEGCPRASQGLLSKAIGSALQRYHRKRRWHAALRATGAASTEIVQWVQSTRMHA